MGSPFRSLSEEEKDLLQGLVRDVHEQFVEAVAEARRLPKEQVSELADGRVFSGRQAKGLGLVDELGGFQEAVKTAAQLAGISGEPKVVEERKEKISLLEILLGKTMGRLIPSVDPRLPFVSYLFHP
jgi:protease-4